MQIWFLSNGSYSLKKCHNPFGKAIQPPPPYGKIPVEHGFSLRGASLSLLTTTNCLFSRNRKKTMFLSRKFANMRSTKALRDYFALPESPQTPATLSSSSSSSPLCLECICRLKLGQIIHQLAPHVHFRPDFGRICGFVNID